MSERASISGGVAPAPWVLPAVKGPLVAQQGGSSSAAAVEAEQRQAWSAGFEQGRREGLAAGTAQLEARQAELAARQAELESAIAQVGQVLSSMSRPLERLDEVAAAELARLALATGTQLARHELRQDPAQVIAIIRECVNVLPASARHVRVHLHPADAAIVRERLAQPAADRAWSVVEDPVLARGGCRVITDVSQVDGRFDSRVAAVVAAILGDEREHERLDEAAGAGDDALPGATP
jgi:flagellar assembly protein FliH